jgi:hypothetical protein
VVASDLFPAGLSIEQSGGGTRLENHQFGSDRVNLTDIKALTDFALRIGWQNAYEPKKRRSNEDR